MTADSTLLKEAEPTRIEIDRRDLSIDGGCELRGLTGHVRVDSPLPEGQLRFLRIAEAPGLHTLDLSGCSGGFDLEIDAASHCRKVRLPETGCRLLLFVDKGFPDTRFFGRIEECQVQCAAGHSVNGFYRIEDCNGLALLSGDALQPRRHIECYLRIDQSRRGLQLKRLRPRIRAEQVSWRLLATSEQADWVPGQLVLLPPHEFSRLALAQNADAVLRRRELLADQEANRGSLTQLVRMYRRGYSPAALWAWRCMLDRSRAGDAHPERPGRAILRARAGNQDSIPWFDPPFNVEDLRLMLLCRPSGLVRRQQRRLLILGEPLALGALIALAATLPQGHDWWRLLVPMARASMAAGLRVARLPREEVKPTEHRAWREFSRPRSTLKLLSQVLSGADRLSHPGLREQLFDYTRDILSPKEAIRLGVELHRQGLSIGRDLVAAGLQDGPDIGQSLHARAMRCLLAQ